MHCGYIVKVEKLRPHTNADRLQVATFFGNDTIVSLETKIGDMGIYFPSGLQLSEEYCEQNNLVRKKDENGKNIGGYLDPDHRNIKAIKLRGEKSDGVFMPLESINYCYSELQNNPDVVVTEFSVGEQIVTVNGHNICCKYVPKTTRRYGTYSDGNRTRKKRVDYAPLFAEHVDTEQLAYNTGAFREGDEIEITLKMHGTSQRTGYLPVHKSYKRTFKDWLLHKEGTPIYNYDYVCGTRRVVLENFDGNTSFYGSNAFREKHHNEFIGKLNKGETVYYEVVGFTDTGAPIMSTGDNTKVGPEFVKQYGPTTIFTYGCSISGSSLQFNEETNNVDIHTEEPLSDMYVYRMTMTNDDGYVVEYTPDQVRHRCEQMGVKTVPVIGKGIVFNNEFWFKPHDKNEWTVYQLEENEIIGDLIVAAAEDYYSGPDPIGKTHTREGVVCRIINRPKFCAYKHKNYEFKQLEGIIQDKIASDTTAEISEDILSEM